MIDISVLNVEIQTVFIQSESAAEHWTDDLPICSQSGVGFSPNQKYRPDGGRREEHEFEDQSFHFHFVDKNCYLYGVFDGYNGRTAAEFAAQKFPAELLFGQLTGALRDNFGGITREGTWVGQHYWVSHETLKNLWGEEDMI